MARVIEYIDKKGEHRIKVIANNNEIIDATSEGFKTKQNAVNNRVLAAVALVKHYSDEISDDDKDDVLKIWMGQS